MISNKEFYKIEELISCDTHLQHKQQLWLINNNHETNLANIHRFTLNYNKTLFWDIL